MQFTKEQLIEQAKTRMEANRYLLTRLPPELATAKEVAMNLAVDEVALAALTQTPAVQAEQFSGNTEQAEPVSAANKLRDGWVAVPKRLTAENGAKAALIGEFNLEYSLTCHECFGDGCEDCSGEGVWTNTIPIDWTTIKEIWAKAIDHFAAAPKQETE